MIYISNYHNSEFCIKNTDLINLFLISGLKLKKVGGKDFWNSAINEIQASKNADLFICAIVKNKELIILGYSLCIKGVFLFIVRVVLKIITNSKNRPFQIDLIHLVKEKKIFKNVSKTLNHIPFGSYKLFKIWNFKSKCNRIQLVWVDKNYRGQGIGEQLYNQLLYLYSSDDSKKLLALVNKKNKASIRLHLKTNWEAIICDDKNILFATVPSECTFD